MIRTIIWFIYFWIYLFVSIPFMLKASKLQKNGKIEELNLYVHKISKDWAISLLKLSGARIKITGEENIPDNKAVLFVSNHQGNFDIPIFIGYVKGLKAFVAKIEILKLPIVRTWMKLLKCVFMDRNDIRQSLKTINEAADNLKNGCSMVIFPEGTRSKSNSINEFKPGSFKLAFKAGVPIIPVTIKGSYKLMEQNGFIIKPADVEVIISKPIETAELTKEEMNELGEKVKSIIEKNLTV